MRKWYIYIGLLSLIVILSACSDKLPIETDMNENVADFSFTNQDNETVSLDNLKGDWWIADFVFTNCTTVCLPMTFNMSQLQKKLAAKNIPMQFISFSVDPDYDQPDVLKAYGEQHDADFDSWSFLTGYDFQTVKELSIKSFRALLKEPEDGDDQVMHDVRFFLVNPEGKIVKGYDGVEASSIDNIIQDLETLQKEALLP